MRVVTLSIGRLPEPTIRRKTSIIVAGEKSLISRKMGIPFTQVDPTGCGLEQVFAEVG